MTYYAEFVTVLLMLLSAHQAARALFATRMLTVAVHTFGAAFCGTVALIGVTILNQGI